jgi:hypothetical protein
MYTNSVAVPREDLAGPIRLQDQSLNEYIAHLLLPAFPTLRRESNIPSVLQTDDQVLDIKHAPKTAYQRVQATLGNKTYRCEEAGIEEPISAEDYDVLGQDGAEALATERGMQIVMRAREAALADVTTGATGETTFTGQVTEPDSTENWGETGGLPIDDVMEADVALTSRIGAGPRWLVIGFEALADLQKNAQIRSVYRSIIGINNPDAVNRKLNLDDLAAVLGVDKVLVGAGRKNTAEKNAAASYSFIWPRLYALLVRGVANPGNLMEPTLGRTFIWTGANAGAQGELKSVDNLTGLAVESYRDESIKSDVIRVTEYTAQKLLNTSAAQLIKLPASD